MRHLLLIILALGICASAWAGNVNLRLGPEGEILGWLVAGPFPNETDKDFKDCKGFETDYIGGEKTVCPIEGRVTSGRTWSLVIGSPETGVDLVKACRTSEAAVAYGYAALVSKEARDVRLLLGSDDGIKVWWNGVLVHTSHFTRGTKRDEEQVDVRMKAGENRLRVKVDQHYGGWGFIVRVANPDGSRAEGITEVLNVSEVNTTGGSLAGLFARASAGKTGSLDVEAAVRYDSVLHKIEVWMPWFREYSPVDLPLLTGRTSWTSKIRAAQSARSVDPLSSTLRNAALDLEGRLDAAFKALRTAMQNPKPLIKTSVSKEDYVRVADGGRYFVHADGKFFTPLGYNHNPEWPRTGESAIGRDWYNPDITDAFFKHLNECGVNLIRMMLEAPAAGFLFEDPIGTFKPEQVAFIDNIVTLARKHDIKLLMTPWDTFWMSHTWDRNPYNAKNGGPVEKKVDFLTRREVIEGQKKRWKFIIDRWGNTGTIFAWELLNESDYWWDSTPEQLQAWTKEMGDFVREYEKQKWGRNHMINISTGRPMPDGGFGDLAYRQPGIDFAQTHLYIGAANAPDEPFGPALAEKQGVLYALSQIKDNRPYIDGENGPINRWIADVNLDNEVFHHMSWAHLASGGAGSSLRWPYRGPHHLTEGMYQHLGRMSRFVKEVPWQKLIGTPAEIKVQVPEGWAACSTGTSQGAIVWVAAPKPSEMKLVLSWNGPETVKYRCYDTHSGEWIGKGTIKPVNGELPIPISGERISVAVVMD